MIAASNPERRDMAHHAQQEFIEAVKGAFPTLFTGRKILEVGSLDINGSVRPFFAGCDFIGLDVRAGPGVDIVCQGQDFRAPDGSFDGVISCEAMEHNPYWKETFANMLRLTKPGGFILMTCASPGRDEHGTTRTDPTASPLTVALGWEHYKNLAAADFRQAIDLREWLSCWGFYREHAVSDLYFIGFRKGPPLAGNARRGLARLRLKYGLHTLGDRNALLKCAALALLGEQPYKALAPARRASAVAILGAAISSASLGRRRRP